jgi:3-hydroxy-9,10-secoandrosta-1,3,5(10)-triene-9,17-dione monooxygenase
MARRVIDNIMDIAGQLRDQAAEAERLGRLPDDTAKLLKSAGPIKLLQPKGYGGFEAHPREFAETVMAVASLVALRMDHAVRYDGGSAVAESNTQRWDRWQ